MAHILIAIVGISILLLVVFSLFNRGASNYEKMISAESITRVNIVTNTGNVTISTYEGDTIRAYLIGENGEHLSKGYKLTMKAKGDEIKINAKKKSKLTQDFIISVELPSKVYEQFQVEADVANIDLDGVQAASYLLKTSVGNINVNTAQGIINANAKVGNVHVQLATIVSDINAKAEVGNILVETQEAPEALQTAAKTEVGTITMDLPNMQDGTIGKGGPVVKLEVGVGDVSLLLGND